MIKAKKIIKYQILSAFLAMFISVVFVQARIESGEVKSVLSMVIIGKALLLFIFNFSFYLILLNPKSKLLLVISFAGISIIDLILMFVNNSSIGVPFKYTETKEAFILLSSLNLTIALFCAFRIYKKP